MIQSKIIICSLIFLFISLTDISKPLADSIPETTTAVTITDADAFYDQAKNEVVNIMSPFISADSAIMAVQLCSSGTPQDSFYDGFENGDGNWVTELLQGYQNPWTIYNDIYPISGTKSLWGLDLASVSNTCKKMKTAVTVPANAFLNFQSGYDLEDYCDPDLGCEYFDGGIVQYSTNGGTSWTDAGSLFIENGYNGTIAGSSGNPLANKSAFVGFSETYKSHKLNLSTLSGKNVLFRFCIGTDSSNTESPFGWLIDDVRIYKCVTSTTTTANQSTTTTTVLSDSDNDGITDAQDNCPQQPNGPQLGTCSSSSDKAGVTCTSDANCASGCSSNGKCLINQEDSDNDGLGDACDNCPIKPNGPQLGTCMPGTGNAGTPCSSDAECVSGCSSNGLCSKNQEDADADGHGSVCDNCPNTCNVQQLDADADSRGDVCDTTPRCGGCTGIACEQQC